MKKYKLELVVLDDGTFSVNATNTGLTAFEIIGFLELKKQDLINQTMDISGPAFKRTATYNGKTVNISND